MILGLNGRAGAGKDTVFEMLQKDFPSYGVTREAFADRLKLSAARNFIPEATLEEAIEFCNRLKVNGSISVSPDDGEPYQIQVSGRQYLQNYGTEAHREVFGYDFWVRQVVDETVEDHEGTIVVTDVRFDNEAEAIKDVGGHIWRIDRPEVEKGDEHASEIPLQGDLIDVVIDNSSSLEDLRAQVAVAFAHEIAAVA